MLLLNVFTLYKKNTKDYSFHLPCSPGAAKESLVSLIVCNLCMGDFERWAESAAEPQHWWKR